MANNIGITNNQDTQLSKLKYNNLEFSTIKGELIRILSRYFSDISTDFTESSGITTIAELIAYVGDSLAFVNDKNFNELFLSRVWETKNLYDLAKGLGYSPQPIKPANCLLNFSVNIPTTGSLTSNYYFVIPTNISFKTNVGNIIFSTNEPVIFDNATSAS